MVPSPENVKLLPHISFEYTWFVLSLLQDISCVTLISATSNVPHKN